MKNRIPPPVLTAISIGAIWLAHQAAPAYLSPSPIFAVTSLLCGIFGIALLIWAGILFKRQQTTVNPFRPNKTSVIVANGPYRFTRNPMYLGMMLLIIAAGISLRHWASIPIVFLFWLYINETQIKPEERALTEAFGGEYKLYMQKVRRWL